MALKVLKNHHALPTCDGPIKASMAVRAFQISAAAMRTPIEDRWAFLESIEAPQWVDLSLEETLQGIEGDDPWFYQSHPYHEVSLEELGCSSELPVYGNSFMEAAAEGQIAQVTVVEGSESHVSSFHKGIPKKPFSLEIGGELNRTVRSQAWPRSKAKRVQLQPSQQNLDDDENRPGAHEVANFGARKMADKGEKVLSTKPGSSADLISVLMDRVRMSDGLSTANKPKDFDNVKPFSPQNKAKESINNLENSRPQRISSTYSRTICNDNGKSCTNYGLFEFRPHRQEKQMSKLKLSSEEEVAFGRPSEDASKMSDLSKKVVRKDKTYGGAKHNQNVATELRTYCNPLCMPESIVSEEDISSGEVEDNEEDMKQQECVNGATDIGADFPTPEPLKPKVFAFSRIKRVETATVRMSLPAVELGKGSQSTKLDPFHSNQVKPRMAGKVSLQGKCAGTLKRELVQMSMTEVKGAIPPKAVNLNQKQSPTRSNTSLVPPASSKKDGRSFHKSSKGHRMHDIKSRTCGVDGDDLAAIIAQHKQRVRVVPTYEPRHHSMRDIKEWEIRTGQRYYSLQPVEREKVNQEISAFKRSHCR